MKMRNTIGAFAFALTLCVATLPAHAQTQNTQSASPASPIPPIDSAGNGGFGKAPVGAARGVSSGSDPEPYTPSQVMPDNNTLAGAQLFGLGSLEHAHNIFNPSISFSELGQSLPNTTGLPTGQSTLSSISMIGGGLAFDRIWSINRLTIFYNGGENFNLGPVYPGTNYSHSQFHQLTVTQQMDWARWHILIRDDFNASPGAAFTGTGMGGPGLIGQFSSALDSTLNSFGQAFIPGETIETGNAMRYRNSALGQAEYSFSRRSAVTFSGSYGLLKFPDAGYVNSHMLNAQAGYDYLLDPTNSVAVLASYGKIDYTYAATAGATALTSSTTDYIAALAYGRKITGRVAFQVEAGPEQIRSAGGNGNFAIWFASVNSALTYERRRSGVSFSFARGLAAGSGVFLGATTNTLSGAAHYDFSRNWTGSVNGGYAFNNNLVPAGATSIGFTNWFIGANLGRQIGRRAQMNFNYGVQRQNNPTCPVASCGGTGFQQTFGMTLNWHLRPAG